MRNFLASSKGIIIVGAVVGLTAALLQFLGNPPNMGICVACFERDIAGALGLHRAGVVQYIRPEIIGLLLGAFIISMVKGENSARGGSAPLIRFFLGLFGMIGALVFLGCPWRALFRLSGGDGNAIVGILGMIVGVYIGTLFLNSGFSLGRAHKTKQASSWVFPIIAVGLFLMLLFEMKLGRGALFLSSKGPGAMHANIWISLAAGLIVGGLAQRSRFCSMGAFRDLFILKDFHLLKGVISLVVIGLIMNLILGQFNPGFAKQPIAHDVHVWNFLGMVLAGLCFSLSGGCPGRQLIMSGEGDSDAGIFVLGMFAGAAVSHNFVLASSPKGVTPSAPYAVALGIIFCLVIGFTMRTKFRFK
jgi:YedE family putative selenium metabolism protein